MSDSARIERATGALVGAVVGDALGAPFEFGSPGEFSAAFPTRVLLDPGEMVGNVTWEPAEWTDDSQMGLLLAQSLLERDGLDEADIFDRFRQWVAGRPKDVGNQTRSVLTSSAGWAHAAADHFVSTGHAAGNGSLMRTVPAALYFADAGPDQTMDAARRISMLTHGDPAAGEGCAIYHELIRVALDGQDPLDHIDDALEAHRSRPGRAVRVPARSGLRPSSRPSRQRRRLARAGSSGVVAAHNRVIRGLPPRQ